MQQLNLPIYSFNFKTVGEGVQIFDSLRKKFVALTPEEWVRQHFVQYLIHEKKTPASLIAIEMSIRVNRLQRRSDIVVHDRNGKPLLMVECKASSVTINQDTFDQIARYNMAVNVKYLVVTNGMSHYYCLMNHEEKRYDFLESLPEYKNL